MTICPQCGAQNGDDTRFCDRCGQGLQPVAGATHAALPPLAVGAELKHGFTIREILGQSSQENRYRAERRNAAGAAERFQLREQAGPVSEPPQEIADDANAPTVHAAAPAYDPNGPHAKTADLKLKLESSQADAMTLEATGGADPDEMRPTAATEAAANGRPEHSETGHSNSTDQTANSTDQPGAGVQATAKVLLTDPIAEGAAAADDLTAVSYGGAAASDSESAPPTTLAPPNTNGVAPASAAQSAEAAPVATAEIAERDDLGELFGRVLGLAHSLKHPAFQRALEGFADGGRVYLVYADETPLTLAERPGGLKLSETQALNVVIQVCQAISFAHRAALRVNDLCPESVALGADRRVQLIGLDHVSNDDELESAPIYNDGYTAPEIYRTRKPSKRADIFSAGALLYSCLTGERLTSEAWRDEAGTIPFYPPHVVTPALEQAVRRALAFEPASRWPTIDAFKAELLRLNGQVKIQAAVLTDVGMVRELNEDSVMAVEYRRDSLVEPAESLLYTVADGMGGAAAGETASAIAVAVIRNYVSTRLERDSPQDRPQDLGEWLRMALEEANSRILDYQTSHPEARGMGSTAASVLIVPPAAAVAWVGDSRVYLYSQGGLRQLTKDHSLVQRLIEIGQLTPEEARHHEHKNVITRSLGARQSGPAGAEVLALRLKRGDRMLLCSDGLTTHVEDPAIAAILGRHRDPVDAARELVVAANAGGGTDNVSVVVIFAN